MNEELLKRLDLLAGKLGVTAQYLWAALMREARVEGLLDAAVAILLLAICAILTRLGIGLVKRDDIDTDIPVLFCAIVSIACMITGMVFLYDAGCELLNPEYFALSQIFRAFK